MINETVNYTIHDFRIQTRSVSHYTMSTHHFHDVYEIYYMNAGSRDYFINDTTYRVKEGNLVLVRPSDLHKTIDTGVSHSRVLINFRTDFLPLKDMDEVIRTCFQTSNVLSFDLAMQQNVEQHLRRMIIEAESQDEFYRSQLQCQLADFLITIARYLKSTEKADVDNPPANQKVYEIIQYLKANYKRNLALEDLAEDFYISRYYMTRIFKKTTGFTIFEYIHSLRVIEAQRLLKETDLKIIDIAQTVGFANVSNFGKVFKSVAGMSPLKYRKHNG